MKPQSHDTNIEAEKVLIELARKAGPARKFAQVSSISGLIMALSRRAIERANPNLSKQQIDILFVRYHYGNDLADRLEKYLLEIKNTES
ncbi:MAG: hypothetical protein JXR46_00410 [Calditrichaceae bacterium]|nr:hypothetical protein [Calditrichaceae bacterium]MBN2707475.1 hypothetical protein [Calditrichaceae bacterium]RQV95566.1 MAG: hypothetical protein EH224_06810 [Calditrichota bacterium]